MKVMMNDFAEKKKKWVFDRRRQLLKTFIPSQNKFKKLLDQANILYVREQPSFKLYTSDVCFMDFYVPYYQLDIEIDGRQHRYKDRFDKDLSKAEFLWNDRIATLRLTNVEVDAMNEIDKESLWEKVPENQRCKIERIKEEQMEGWKLFFSHRNIDLDSPIWLYYNENRKTYRFDNILELQRSVHYPNEKVLGVLKGEMKSNFLVSFDEEEMKMMVRRREIKKSYSF